MTTAYLYSPVFLEHEEEGHPESPERLEAIMRVLRETGVLSRLTALEPIPRESPLSVAAKPKRAKVKSA